MSGWTGGRRDDGKAASLKTKWLTLLLFAGACVHSARPVLSVQYTPRSPFGDSALSFPLPSDDATDALGWPVLARVTLPAGTRELRMSDWYSMMAGSPAAVVRLVEQPGRPPVGQVVMVWHEAREWGPSRDQGQCTDWKSGSRHCGKVVRDTIDWPVAAARFAELGAWDMTAPCVTRNEAIMDAGDLHIQRLQGSREDRYSCNAPSHRTDSDAGRAALALYNYYGSLVSHAAPSPTPRRVHVEGGFGLASATTADRHLLVDRFVSTTFDVDEPLALGLEASSATSSGEVCLTSLPETARCNSRLFMESRLQSHSAFWIESISAPVRASITDFNTLETRDTQEGWTRMPPCGSSASVRSTRRCRRGHSSRSDRGCSRANGSGSFRYAIGMKW